MTYALALAIAVQFWTARDYKVPCTPRPVVGAAADAVLPPDEWGNVQGMGALVDKCVIYISSAAAELRTGGIQTWPTYCADVAHEVGHLVGRPHSDDPTSIMYPVVDDTNAPWNCWHAKTFSRRLKLRSATSP